MGNKSIVGVDIRTDSVRVLQFIDTLRGRKIWGSGSASIRSGSIVNGVVEDAKSVGQAIREACVNAKPYAIKTHEFAGCTLPEIKTFIRVVMLPQMDKGAVGEAVKWEMEAYIPMAIEDISYDWHIVAQHYGDDNQMAVLVVAVANQILAGYIDALSSAQLWPATIEAESIAQIRALPQKVISQSGMVLVFMGKYSTRISIVANGAPLFTASVMIGRVSLESDIQKTLRVSQQEACRILDTQEIESYSSNNDVFKAMKPNVDMIVEEIDKSMRFCHTSLPMCAEVTKLVFCGDGLVINGLQKYFIKQLKLTSVDVNPWENAELDSKTPSALIDSQAIDTITMIGLAINEYDYADLY